MAAFAVSAFVVAGHFLVTGKSRALLSLRALAVVAAMPALVSVDAAMAAGRCSPARVDIRPAPGAVGGTPQSFIVEIADTPASRSLGLMHRTDLAADSGMLFIYERPGRAEFWMKNTLIPLDIVFADSRGRVTVVHENAVPGDLTPIPGGDGVEFVLEINGGLARRLGIAAGSEMRHPAITGAAWPCE